MHSPYPVSVEFYSQIKPMMMMMMMMMMYFDSNILARQSSLRWVRGSLVAALVFFFFFFFFFLFGFGFPPFPGSAVLAAVLAIGVAHSDGCRMLTTTTVRGSGVRFQTECSNESSKQSHAPSVQRRVSPVDANCGCNIGLQAPFSMPSAWPPSRVRRTARAGCRMG